MESACEYVRNGLYNEILHICPYITKSDISKLLRYIRDNDIEDIFEDCYNHSEASGITKSFKRIGKTNLGVKVAQDALMRDMSVDESYCDNDVDNQLYNEVKRFDNQLKQCLIRTTEYNIGPIVPILFNWLCSDARAYCSNLFLFNHVTIVPRARHIIELRTEYDRLTNWEKKHIAPYKFNRCYVNTASVHDAFNWSVDNGMQDVLDNEGNAGYFYNHLTKKYDCLIVDYSL